MSLIKFFNVEHGDMAYINHGTDNFSIIDCNLPNEDNHKKLIINELKSIRYNKNIFRFISTHPDEDHIHGIEDIDNEIGIDNFYCVNNNAQKDDETESFKKYYSLKNSDRAFFISKNCKRKWLNQGSDSIGSSGISILWPDLNNAFFKKELSKVNGSTESPNNISSIIMYSLQDSARLLWMGDLETNFLKNVESDINWKPVDILLAPHHGRKSGYVGSDVLNKLNPSLIILGYAESKDMNYYNGWNTILKKRSGDITMECRNGYIDIWVDNMNYSPTAKCLVYINNISDNHKELNYIGSIIAKQ